MKTLVALTAALGILAAGTPAAFAAKAAEKPAIERTVARKATKVAALKKRFVKKTRRAASKVAHKRHDVRKVAAIKAAPKKVVRDTAKRGKPHG